MQCTLLVMCITWKFRQRRLGIDDFGNPLPDHHGYRPSSSPGVYSEEVPGLVISEDDDPAAVSRALAAALESAVETDVRSHGANEIPSVDEETPLLSAPKDMHDKGGKGWFNWFQG